MQQHVNSSSTMEHGRGLTTIEHGIEEDVRERVGAVGGLPELVEGGFGPRTDRNIPVDTLLKLVRRNLVKLDGLTITIDPDLPPLVLRHIPTYAPNADNASRSRASYTLPRLLVITKHLREFSHSSTPRSAVNPHRAHVLVPEGKIYSARPIEQGKGASGENRVSILGMLEE